jgi:hypothetical protein
MSLAELTPDQQQKRQQLESVIDRIAPGLDLLLAAGDRISRLAEPQDHDYYPTETGTQPPSRSCATPYDQKR